MLLSTLELFALEAPAVAEAAKICLVRLQVVGRPRIERAPFYGSVDRDADIVDNGVGDRLTGSKKCPPAVSRRDRSTGVRPVRYSTKLGSRRRAAGSVSASRSNRTEPSRTKSTPSSLPICIGRSRDRCNCLRYTDPRDETESPDGSQAFGGLFGQARRQRRRRRAFPGSRRG